PHRGIALGDERDPVDRPQHVLGRQVGGDRAARALDDPPPLGEHVLYQPHGDGAAAGGDGEHVVVGGDGGLTGDVLGEVEQGAGGGEQLVLAVAGGLPGQGAGGAPVDGGCCQGS